ncbi:MAG: hypothetical protein U0452_06970 [Anaerolineae bacterium]
MARKVIMVLDSDLSGQNATRRSLEVAREALRADFGGKLGVESCSPRWMAKTRTISSARTRMSGRRWWTARRCC